MSEQPLYVVRDKHRRTIQAVFSNEGLAQTHMAKLKLIDVASFGGPTYVVEPLDVDTFTQYEPRYYAIYTTTTFEPELREREIESGCDTLALQLDPPTMDTSDPELVSFATSGWSEEEAIRTLVDAVKAYVAKWYVETDPNGELYG
jgi:hypothetical protein